MLSGIQFLRAVKDALNLPPGTEKVVIEASARGPVRVYVKGLMGDAALPAVAEAVRDVTVSDTGEVSAVPASCPECGEQPPRHKIRCMTGIRALVINPPTDAEAAAIRADLLNQMSGPTVVMTDSYSVTEATACDFGKPE